MKKYAPFHEQLRYERERRNWSQADLAEKVGCDTKTVTRWENGNAFPRSDSRRTICELFGKTAEEFGLIEKRMPSSGPFSSPATDVGHEPLAESSSSPFATPSLTTENSTDTSDAFQSSRNDVLQHIGQAETSFDASPTSPPSTSSNTRKGSSAQAGERDNTVYLPRSHQLGACGCLGAKR